MNIKSLQQPGHHPFLRVLANRNELRQLLKNSSVAFAAHCPDRSKHSRSLLSSNAMDSIKMYQMQNYAYSPSLGIPPHETGKNARVCMLEEATVDFSHFALYFSPLAFASPGNNEIIHEPSGAPNAQECEPKVCIYNSDCTGSQKPTCVGYRCSSGNSCTNDGDCLYGEKCNSSSVCEERCPNAINEFTSPSDNKPEHATQTASLINAYYPAASILGGAPGASVYSANTPNSQTGIDWCVAKKADVINVSFIYGPGIKYTGNFKTYQTTAYMDYTAEFYDKLFVGGAGNDRVPSQFCDPTNPCVPPKVCVDTVCVSNTTCTQNSQCLSTEYCDTTVGKCRYHEMYSENVIINGLTVGAYKHFATESWSDDKLWQYTNLRNPNTPGGDLLKPDLFAPGSGIIVASRTTSGTHIWATADGTSLATPIVSSFAAQVVSWSTLHFTYGIRNYFKNQPQLIKALLKNSSCNRLVADANSPLPRSQIGEGGVSAKLVKETLQQLPTSFLLNPTPPFYAYQVMLDVTIDFNSGGYYRWGENGRPGIHCFDVPTNHTLRFTFTWETPVNFSSYTYKPQVDLDAYLYFGSDLDSLTYYPTGWPAASSTKWDDVTETLEWKNTQSPEPVRVCVQLKKYYSDPNTDYTFRLAWAAHFFEHDCDSSVQ